MSKSLEALERLQEETQPNAYTLNHNDEDFETIKQDLEKLERLEKAIEILKREFQFHIQDNFLWIYDDYFGALETFSLTEEEIKLLKEVLENEN